MTPDTVFPVSPAQRYWLDRAAVPDVARAMTTTRAFRVTGPLRPDALCQAARVLVDRHEPLRTSFAVDDDDVVRQRVGAVGELPVTVVDLRAAADPETAALTVVRDTAVRPLDPAHAPLASITVLRLADHDHVLVVTLHLLIADADSLGVFFGELGLRYAAEVDRTTVDLPTLDVQHVDWTVWRLEQLTPPRDAELLAWWQHTVRDARWGLPRPERIGRRGRRVCGTPLPVDAIANLARRARTTFFAVLAAACGVLIGRLTGHDRVVLLIPLADRDEAGMAGALGFFVDVVPLCVDLSGDPAPGELVSRVGRAVFAAHDHKALPLDQIMSGAACPHGVVPVNFAHRRSDRLGVLRLSGCAVLDVPIDLEHVKVDLTIAVDETPRGLVVVAEFDDGLFRAGTIEELVADYEAVLRELVT